MSRFCYYLSRDQRHYLFTVSGTTIRGDPHFLLIGDPGTGKSKFLKHAASLAKRSTYSTGVGITSAGLTCAAVKVDGDWQLEPGALPLSHGGFVY